MAIHQCARFNNYPHLSHEQVVKRIGRYLLDTNRPDITRGLDCYVDADFAGGWKYGNHDSP